MEEGFKKEDDKVDYYLEKRFKKSLGKEVIYIKDMHDVEDFFKWHKPKAKLQRTLKRLICIF